MILLLGILADPVVTHLAARLLARDVDFLLLDPRQYLREFDLTWSMEEGAWEGEICYGSQRVDLTQVQSAYLRQTRASGRSQVGEQDDEAAARFQAEAYYSLKTFANSWPALVVNRPAASNSNSSKPYQQRLIARHGFRVPRTLVATEPGEACRFYEECRGRVIYKSVSHKRSIVRRMTPADLQRLGEIRRCPTQFQEYIPGVDLRVHTVGSRVFATEVATDAVDYRYAGRDGAEREMRSVELPSDLAAQCLRVVADLGLVVGGVDLRRTPEGEYYCFEVNPSPAFTFYEDHTGQRIGDAVVDLLARGVA
jgi:glutathione synthase/RimK-type ligase-like ATP-grasp enzyme